MAKSNKPVIWGLFAAGGTVAAFFTPVLIVVTLAAALGKLPAGLSYEALHAGLGHWLVKVVAFGVVSLSLWGAAHRLRITCHDFGLRVDGPVAVVVYLVAAAGTLATLAFLWRI